MFYSGVIGGRGVLMAGLRKGWQWMAKAGQERLAALACGIGKRGFEVVGLKITHAGSGFKRLIGCLEA